MKKSYFWAFAFLLFFVDEGVSQELIDPGWDDPAFEHYLSVIESLDGTDRDAITKGLVAASDNVTFTLPVLGFAAIERPNGLRDGLVNPDLGPEALGANIPDWPECAETLPEIVTIPSDREMAEGTRIGSWYVRTIDYGCMQIVLEGDRNPLPNGFAKPELGESGSIEIDWFDENDGTEVDHEGHVQHTDSLQSDVRLRGVPNATITIGSLQYGMSIYCNDFETLAFCNNKTAIELLAQRLTVVGGEPD